MTWKFSTFIHNVRLHNVIKFNFFVCLCLSNNKRTI